MEENTNGELTFKMIWQRIKRSGVRIIVYVLIALIVGAGILGLADVIFSKSQFETRITYYYEGVEEGTDPWGGQMDFVNGVKSVSNVSKALSIKCGYSEEEVAELLDPVIKNLTVITDTTNVNKDAEEVILNADYNFRIIITQSGEIDKYLNSKNDYYNMVDAITSTYIESFKNKYSYSTDLSEISSAGTNYLDKYYNIRNLLVIMKSEADSLAAKAPLFESTTQNLSFSNLAKRAETLALELDTYKYFIVSNGIDSGSEKSNIDARVQEYTDRVATYEKNVTTYTTAFEKLCSQSNIIIPSDPSQIYQIVNQQGKDIIDNLIASIDTLTEAQNNLNDWTYYKTCYENANFSSKPEEEKNQIIANADEMEADLIADANAVLAAYQNMIKDYNESYNVQSLVRVTSQATKTKDSPITLVVFVIIEAVVLILAVIIAMGVTAKKGEMILRKKLKLGAKSDDTNTENKE